MTDGKVEEGSLLEEEELDEDEVRSCIADIEFVLEVGDLSPFHPYKTPTVEQRRRRRHR